MNRFRVFGPDENTSNKLQDIYAVSKKFWIAEYFPEDADGSELATDGRVIEMLSEHTMEGMLEGYLLTGRHGFISSYEAFVHVIDSMFNQHAKWLSISKDLSWREEISSLNLLITSTVRCQDHNGFSHQDPGFLDVVVNKSATVTRIYLPPDVNSLLSVADESSQRARVFRFYLSWLVDLYAIPSEIGHVQGFPEESSIGVRIRAHPADTGWRQFSEFWDQFAFCIEQFFRFLCAHPLLENPEFLGVLLHIRHGNRLNRESRGITPLLILLRADAA